MGLGHRALQPRETAERVPPSCDRGRYEGLVAKDNAAPYSEGRTLSWLKVKQPHYREGERGWEPVAEID